MKIASGQMTFFVARDPILWPDLPTKWQTLHHCLLSKNLLVGDKKDSVLKTIAVFEGKSVKQQKMQVDICVIFAGSIHGCIVAKMPGTSGPFFKARRQSKPDRKMTY